MVSKTLFLTGGMPKESKQRHLLKAISDSKLTSIHIVGQDFQDDDDVTRIISALFHFDNRNLNTVKLTSCRGRMDLIIEAVMASTVRRLILSPEEPRIWLPALSQGLISNKSLLTLGLHDMDFTSARMSMLCCGLEENTAVIELSFCQSRFHDGAVASLSKSLKKWKPIQHLSFQNCRLSDKECEQVVTSLVGQPSLLELSLDGNQCRSLGMNALADMLPHSNLLVLDLSSQKLDNEHQSLDLKQLSKGLMKSKVRCLQLSDNRISDESMTHLAAGLAENNSLRILHLAWCRLSDDSVFELAESLRRNLTLSKLVLYDCEIGNAGISRFSMRLGQMKGLKRLDLGGRQNFDAEAVQRLVNGLKRNMELEGVVLRPCEEAHRIGFYCDLNRGGRRVFRATKRAPASLWPSILARVQDMDLPSTIDAMSDGAVHAPNAKGTVDKCSQDDTRRASVLFHLLRNGPLLEH
jgi:Ran GTPase-activating protein (RanGAP) involved in mRNA processing and transport